MVGFGSVGAVIGVIFLASFIHVATERAQGLGVVVAGTAALVQGVAPWLVPLVIFVASTLCAARRYAPTDREILLVAMVAGALYVMHLPLILLLWLMTGMTRWPWR